MVRINIIKNVFYKIITKGSLGKDNKSFKHVIKYDERGF